MKLGHSASAIVIVTVVGVSGDRRASATAAHADQSPVLPTATSRSVWDGIYTGAQQKRGEAVYIRECSTCHGETLKGGEGSPALAGADFIASWNGQTVADLLDKIRVTMPAPPEQPGKLSPQQNADVVSHILSANGFPAGSAELPTDVGPLKSTRIVAKP